MSQCIRCRITGKVQGVWFRESTRQQAEQLGITGSARNCSNGSVEVIACGDTTALEALQQWLHQGSELAQVTAVECEPVSSQVLSGFSTA